MKTEKLLIYAVSIAALAGIVDMVTNVMQASGIVSTTTSLTFITFICWASYFLFGASPKGAISGFLGFTIGIISAILMFVLAGIFIGKGMDVNTLGIPLAVFVVVIFMCLFEKVPYFNNVAAIFLGTGMFFGLMGIPDLATKGFGIVAAGELIYAALGFVAGWLTIVIRIAIEKSGSQPEAAQKAS